MPQQIEYNGELHEFPDDFTDADIAQALGALDIPAPKEELSSGGATALTAGARAVPGIVHGAARFAANHVPAVQKMFGAGTTAVTSGIGGALGSTFGPAGAITGAMAGGMVRGLTPTQGTIRETAGRLAGETPAVAKNANRAMGVVHYAKEMGGLKLDPLDLISTGEPAKAIDNFAGANGQKVVRLYDAYNKMAVGPEMAPQVAKASPGIVRKAVGATAGAVGKVLSPLSVMTGATDLAQTLEPTRRDIGVMGIGSPQPDPSGAELEQLDARNKAAMEARLQEQAKQVPFIQQLLQALGLRQ